MKNLRNFLSLICAASIICLSFFVNSNASAQSCTVCALQLNDATLRVDESGCYCIGFGSECKFEAAGECEVETDT